MCRGASIQAPVCDDVDGMTMVLHGITVAAGNTRHVCIMDIVFKVNAASKASNGPSIPQAGPSQYPAPPATHLARLQRIPVLPELARSILHRHLRAPGTPQPSKPLQ